MSEMLEIPGAKILLSLAALATMVAVGYYIIAKVRQSVLDAGPSPHDLLTNFRELHSKGDLEDEEYRTIKGTLVERLQDEIKDDEESG